MSIFLGSQEVNCVGLDKVYLGNQLVWRDAIPISIPTLSGSYTYTGSTITPTWNDYDSTQIDIGGTYSATNAGTYTATFTPKDGYIWTDESTTTQSVSWSIAKATCSVSISSTSLSIYGSFSKTITVTRSGNGVVNAVSSDTNTCTVSVSNTSVTATAKNIDGSAVIVINVAESTNYLASTSVTCDVTTLETIYKFYTSSSVEITDISVSGLADAYYYTKNGGNMLRVGGRIFYINTNAVEGVDDEFYVYDTTNGIVSNKIWGGTYQYYSITANYIGSGKINTAAAIAAGLGGIWYYVTNTLNANSVGGCNDWFIGSMAEQNKLKESGLLTWYSEDYKIWSSVERASDYAYCWNGDTGWRYWYSFYWKGNVGSCFGMRAF